MSLAVAHLSARRGARQVLTDVSFNAHPGEILGVIGPNGAGKTTLFDLISGFLVADEGEILLDGELIDSLRPDQRGSRGLGRSFQDARLFGDLTVLENLQVALDSQLEVQDPIAAAMGLPDVTDAERTIAQKAEDILGRMGLSERDHTFVSELSTGSRRIVDMACQFAREPRVLLFDEPSSGIAQREAEALGPALLRLRDESGASLLVVEHDMGLISSIADRMVALDLGRVVCEGDPATVLDHPDVVASYLGGSEAAMRRSGPPGARRGARAPA